MPHTALLAGATGLIGSHCLRLLLEQERYDSVVALVRRPLGMDHPRLRECRVDFAHLDRLAPFAVDDVYCALGTTIRKAGSPEAFRAVDHDAPLALARWAVANGARQMMLVSSVDASPRAGSFYLRVKGELEQAVGALPWNQLHLFRPSILVGERSESRPGERAGLLVARGLQWAMVGGLRRYRPIEAATVASAMVNSARAGGARGAHVYQFDEVRRLAQPR